VVWGILVMLEAIVIGTLIILAAIILAAGVLWVRPWYDDYLHPYD